MITQEESMEIRILYRQGKNIREIAKLLNVSRNTVRKYLRTEGEPLYKARCIGSKLDPFKEYITARLKKAHPIKIPGTVLLKEIRSQGYSGEISILRDYLKNITEVKEEKIIRFETEPGRQMQVDWTIMQRSPWRISAFVAVLGYSRKAYVEFVGDEQEETLIRCHANAFDYFEGIPEEILYDNMKTVIIQRDKYGNGKHGFQKTFADFSKHYGFIPRVCKPYRAQTKGKVERFNRYLKESFYFPLVTKKEVEEKSYGFLNIEVRRWLKEEADRRILREIGKSPEELFREEIKQLQKIPEAYCLIKKKKEVRSIEVFQHDLSIYDLLVRG